MGKQILIVAVVDAEQVDQVKLPHGAPYHAQEVYTEQLREFDALEINFRAAGLALERYFKNKGAIKTGAVELPEDEFKGVGNEETNRGGGV